MRDGRTCPLGEIGHARDGVRGRLKIVYGVLTTAGGIPVAVEVFKGATGDPATVGAQVTKLKQRFGLTRVAVAGDRGMLTKGPHQRRPAARGAGLDHRAARPGHPGAHQPGSDPAHLVRRDGHGRDHLRGLARGAADRLLQPVPGRRAGPAGAASCWPPPRPSWRRSPRPPAARRPLRGKDNIALAVGKVINNKKVAKRFITEITDEGPGLAAG